MGKKIKRVKMPHNLISEEEAGEVVKTAKSSEKKSATSRAIMSFFSIAVLLGIIAGIIIMEIGRASCRERV